MTILKLSTDYKDPKKQYNSLILQKKTPLHTEKQSYYNK